MLAIVVLSAAAYDLSYRRIPNWLNLSGIIAGFMLNVFFLHLHGLVLTVEGLFLAVAIYLPLYLLRGMGAGDVKLMAAVGAIVGPTHWLTVLLATALTGGVVGSTYALLKGRLTETCCNLYFLVKDLIQLRAPHATNPQLDFTNPAALRMPHGAIIALGCFLVMTLNFVVPNWFSRLF
jgi:prepilin peptidase CpaA